MNPPRVDRMQTALWAAVGIALLVLFYMLSPILTPFVVAAAFAYICDPAVNWLVGRRVPRAAAVLLVILAAGLAVVILVVIFVPMVSREASALISRLPELVELFRDRVAPMLSSRFGITLELDIESVKNWVSEHGDSAKSMIPALLVHARAGGSAVISVVTNLVLIPIVMFYLLQEWPRITASLKHAIPRPMIDKTMRIVRDIDSVLSEFLRGQLSVMLILAVYYSAGLWLAGLNFALPVGVLTGLLAFVPFVGFGGGLILAILAALLQGDGLPLLIGVGVVYTIGQLVESYVLTPYLVGERIGLHPLAVIFALMAFGQLFGFIGMLIALPASAAILVGLREVRSAWFSSQVYLGQTRLAQPLIEPAAPSTKQAHISQDKTER